MAAITILGLVSIWFSNPHDLLTTSGLVGAGIAFALPKVITVLATGSRWAECCKDVIALGFIQTTVMEMASRRRSRPTRRPCGFGRGSTPGAS